MSATRKIKRNIKRPNFSKIKNKVLDATDSAISSVEKVADTISRQASNTATKIQKGKYEGEFINEYSGNNPEGEDIKGSAWIEIYKVDEYDMDEDYQIIKFNSKIGNRQELDSPELKEYLKEKKYREKISARYADRILKKKKIVIPYDNINDFNPNNIQDDFLKKINNDNNLDEFYIKIEENRVLYYYITVPIKKSERYAIIKRTLNDDIKKNEKDLAKSEKKRSLDLKKSEAKELIDALEYDILSDNNLLPSISPSKPYLILPSSKLANTFCYIHPINVLFYEKIIIYGLKWKLTDEDTINDDKYNNIQDFLTSKNDSQKFTLFSNIFKEEYDKQIGNSDASIETSDSGDEAYVGGANNPLKDGNDDNTEVVDLSDSKEIRNLVYNNGYLDDFASETLYHLHNNKIYLCKNSKLDYRYNHKTWDKKKYYEENSIDKIGLKTNLITIQKLHGNLTTALKELREKAREHGDINKDKNIERQDESDKRFNDAAGIIGFNLTKLFIYITKYIQDTFLAGIKTLFSSKWNNVMTGFMILLFIIIVLIIGASVGGENDNGNSGPNKKPKEENKDFISLLKSMPANFNNAYATFNNFATDFGNIVTNGRRAANDFADAMTGDNTPDISSRIKYDEEDGRGGDNIIHFDNDDRNYVNSAYEPIAKIIPNDDNIVNKPTPGNTIPDPEFGITNVASGKGKLYKLDCTEGEISKYFTESCKLRKDYTLDSRFIKEPESDYEQIKIND